MTSNESRTHLTSSRIDAKLKIKWREQSNIVINWANENSLAPTLRPVELKMAHDKHSRVFTPNDRKETELNRRQTRKGGWVSTRSVSSSEAANPMYRLAASHKKGPLKP